MKFIHKKFLDIKKGQLFFACQDVIPLDVQRQKNNFALWYQVNTDSTVVEHQIHVVGTGHELPSGNLEYIATVQDNGGFVWHFYLERAQ
jgi:hypothetical protein